MRDLDDVKQLSADLDDLQRAIDQLRAGYVGTDAARVRYYAAIVSRQAETAELPRRTSCRWDLHENRAERKAAKRAS